MWHMPQVELSFRTAMTTPGKPCLRVKKKRGGGGIIKELKANTIQNYIPNQKMGHYMKNGYGYIRSIDLNLGLIIVWIFFNMELIFKNL